MKDQKQLNAMLGGCITDVLFYISQLHYTHWLTLKNHHHVVVGELYTELEEELDVLVESYLGASLPSLRPEDALNSMKASKTPHYFRPIKSEADIISLIEEIVARIEKGLGLIESNPKYSFMRDSLMDMAAALHSAKYQITQQ